MANILWIDDKAEAGDTTRLGFNGLIYFIEKNGHSIDIASTGESVEEALKNHASYDVIIMDIIMDALSISTEKDQFGGFDAIQLLEQMNSHTPIIILSVMEVPMLKDEAKRRNIDLNHSSVKEILRKGIILPSELASIIEIVIAENKSILEGNNT